MSYVNVVLDTLVENGEGNPLYPHADLSSARLQSLHKRTRAEQDKYGDEMIATGRGYEKPSETRTKTDPLSQKVDDAHDRMYHVRAEMDRRMRGHGKMTPLPLHYRYSFYGGNLR
jgi:hypothetical protein